MWCRIGVVDMAMDLDESRWVMSGVPTRRLFPSLEPMAWQWRGSYKRVTQKGNFCVTLDSEILIYTSTLRFPHLRKP